MTDKLMKFMEMVSADDSLSAKVFGASDNNTIIAIAKEMGVELTENDFKSQPMELSDDDLDVVSGGSAVNCSCAMGGGGSGDANDKTCACVAAGLGYSKDNTRRCFCAIAGFGYDY